ncbi:MAG: acyl-CoA dehydrogenase family protein, partial [Desulfobacteraceae bacterium]|nr:acyl-CoA dehydrogenase family protein [Desulfobacteraceae bacterium]
MNDLLEPQKHALSETIRQFLKENCPPETIRAFEASELPPLDIRDKMKSLGIFGYTIPEAYGGAGVQLSSAALVVEELSRVWPALAWIYIGSVFYGGSNIANLGTAEQKKKFLPLLARGDLIMAYALTEPEAGSDTTAAQLTALPDGNEFVISGSKTFISLADKADWLITLTRTDPDAPQRKGLSMFLIPNGVKGLSFNKIAKLGYLSSSLCEVFFDGVRVPAENVLGGPEMLNHGMSQLLQTLDVEHLEIAACGVGVAQGALDLTLAYAKKHHRDGIPMMKNQSITHKLAEMATQLHAARLILYNGCQ